MAIAIALPGFDDLGHSVTPIFLLMDQFRYRFPTFSKKNEENLLIRSYNFMKNEPWNSTIFSSSFIYRCGCFKMPLKRSSFVKMLATFGIIKETGSLNSLNKYTKYY